ncbi:hypothetical protein E3Q19_01795 [Wallemia mellicola]|nr:hypothetical protein E3Q19_01795 [Wallemia mellicola]TIC74674.1 hypothetical protein E3Q00_01669 [Wallemia mellicola]
MGKKNNKLKSTLERHKANQAVKQQMKAQEKKSDKGKLSAKPDKIPFREDDTVLLVGEVIDLYEGNFSFTLSLVVDHQFEPGQLTSTAIDTEEEAYAKYDDCREIVDTLKSKGVRVLFQVDATRLDKCKELNGMKFNKIYFGFPHLGLGIKDQDRNVLVNQALILRFFASAQKFLTSGAIDYNFKGKVGLEREEEEDIPDNEEKGRKGVVVITLKQTKPYNLWNLAGLAKNPPIELPDTPTNKDKGKSVKYKILKSTSFNLDFYPKYAHKKTKSSEKNKVNYQEIRSYHFIVNDEEKYAIISENMDDYINKFRLNLVNHQQQLQQNFDYDRISLLNTTHNDLSLSYQQSSITAAHESKKRKQAIVQQSPQHKKQRLPAPPSPPSEQAPPSPPQPPVQQLNIPEYQGLDADYCLPTTALERAKQVEDAQTAIWLHISRKEIPKAYKYSTSTYTSHLSFHKRISLLTQREQRKLTTRTTKSNKEVQAKAKKVMREVLFHWRRNEKDERDVRRKADREAYDRARAEEQSRESKRQARKLNFLITQTELYSHFVGNKIKTDEAEQSNDTAGDPNLEQSGTPIQPPQFDFRKFDESNLGDIDYDDEDESNLRMHAAKNAQQAWLNTRDKANQFDKNAAEDRRKNEAIQKAREMGVEVPPEAEQAPLENDELNFQNPNLGEDSVQVEQPKLLAAELKDYQLKGLNWLANLYEQGINGILADEMGLGKTVQSISLMAYLAEKHDIWGPFLIITPASTLHNWQQEISRFVPSLKPLPYWGSTKDRAALRKFWQRKAITYTKDAPFHVLITSYQLVLSDEKYFKNVKWQYMILDEAQAIKSSQSARWNTLLSFKCRNRLLLTGTPVQNSMQELWALLHFIMPSLFDSHDEFAEWFSKDIESNAENKGAINDNQLKRLHMILKPFMLRRVKKNVQNELGDKIEIDVHCDLSQRQRALYRLLRSRISITSLIEKASKGNDEASKRGLMNLVMQFRKVCNHPDLFERADVKTPFVMSKWSRYKSTREPDVHYCPDQFESLIDLKLPRLIADDVEIGGGAGTPEGRSKFGSNKLQSLFNIWSPDYILKSMLKENSPFAFLPQAGISADEAARIFSTTEFSRLLLAYNKAIAQNEHQGYNDDDDLIASTLNKKFNITRPFPYKTDVEEYSDKPLPKLNEIASNMISSSVLLRRSSKYMSGIKRVLAPSPYPYILHRPSLDRIEWRTKQDDEINKAFFGLQTTHLKENTKAVETLPPNIPPAGLVENSDRIQLPPSTMTVPEPNKLIIDSSKLVALDELLPKLKAEGHRVLIYFQMTKMIDLIQEYLIYKGYKYLRLDGSSKINDRRDMVQAWQTSDEYFIFCLSTRAGGLGINLTAADTVIFFEHDWNPSNDQQAMDRAHRLGQKRQVTVYRLITKGTVDERIIKLARVKKDIQDMVVGQKPVGEKENSGPNEREIIQMLMEEDQDPIEADIMGGSNDLDTELLNDGTNLDDDGMFNGEASNNNTGNGTPMSTPSKTSTPRPGSRPVGRPPGSTNKDRTPSGQISQDGKPKKRFRRTKKQMEEDAAAAAAHEAYLIKEGIAPEKKKRGRKPKLQVEQEAQAQRQFEELQARNAMASNN